MTYKLRQELRQDAGARRARQLATIAGLRERNNTLMLEALEAAGLKPERVTNEDTVYFSDRDPYDVVCPTCKATPKNKCTTSTGKTTKAHITRKEEGTWDACIKVRDIPEIAGVREALALALHTRARDECRVGIETADVEVEMNATAVFTPQASGSYRCNRSTGMTGIRPETRFSTDEFNLMIEKGLAVTLLPTDGPELPREEFQGDYDKNYNIS
jgi:hypothetical protein